MLTRRAPDTARIKAKMVYASSKEVIRKALVGIQAEMQASDKSDLEWNAVFEKASRFN